MKQNLAYLDAMGIDVWVRRESPSAEAVVPTATTSTVIEELSEDTQKTSPPEPQLNPPAKPITSELAEDKIVQATPADLPMSEADNWQQLEAQVSQCRQCDLHQTRTQTVFGVGHRQADWMIIGEAPGAEEDRQGQPFVGRAGQLLNAMLAAVDQQREQVFITNILKCRPPSNRDPEPQEVIHCETYLHRQIALIQPKLILCVGKIAAQNLLKIDTPIGQMRGKKYTYADLGIPVVVTYHPAYLLRKPTEKGKSWQDLLLAKSLIDLAHDQHT